MLTYTWDMFRKECELLAQHVSGYEYTDLVVIERGGLYVAQELLRYVKHNPIVHTVKVSFYSGKIRNDKPVVRWTNKTFSKNSKVLVVDDLIDSGSTIEFLKTYDGLKNIEMLKFAVLAIKDISPFKSDFYVRDNVNGWVVFPWEDAEGEHIAPVSHTLKGVAAG